MRYASRAALVAASTGYLPVAGGVSDGQSGSSSILIPEKFKKGLDSATKLI